VTETTRQPIYPPGRYGRRRETGRRRRGRTVLVSVLGALAGLVLAVVMFNRYQSRYEPQVLRFDTTDRSATVQFHVTHQGERDLDCHARSRARDGAVVGTATIRIPAGVTGPVTHTLTTTRAPVSAEVTVCRAVS
jgi:hypothetical protein